MVSPAGPGTQGPSRPQVWAGTKPRLTSTIEPSAWRNGVITQ